MGNNPPNNGGNHGNMVMGIVGARGGNGIGVSGIASEVNLSGYTPFVCNNFLAAPNVPGVHVWNGSYGVPGCTSHKPSYSSSGIMANEPKAFTNSAIQNRIAFFKAAGNGRSGGRCGNGGFEDANRDPTNVSPYVGIIAALGVEGEVTTYSTPSASLLVSAFAGYGGSNSSAGIWTTSGNNTYTSNMNGTSAATPVTTGVAAIIKEANPDLGPLDIFYILAQTARPLVESAKTTSFRSKNISGISGKQYINHQKNAKGYHHSYNAGFGIVNLDKAVKTAEFVTTTLPDLKRYSESNNIPIPKKIGPTTVNAKSCAIKEIDLANDFQVFSLEISFKATGVVKQMVGFYTMPDGTEATIFRDSNIQGSQYSHRQRFKVMSALGINAKGKWKFELCNNGTSAITYEEVQFDVWGFEDIDTLKESYQEL
jgi:subtilisin family serine protease